MTFGASAIAALAIATGTPPPAVSLSATPARLELDAHETGAVALRNLGRSPVVVAARAGSVALDPSGRPRVVAKRGVARSSAEWLAIRPRDLVVRPGDRALVEVEARVPRRAEPGDHHGVVLLSTRPAGGVVGVRARVGVRVIVHVPGTIVRRVAVRRLRVRRSPRMRTLVLTLANTGNVTERLAPTISLLARGRALARMRLGGRELLPGGIAVFAAGYRGRARGAATARVELGGVVREIRIRL